MRGDVHGNWCVNVCQRVLCALSSLSRLLRVAFRSPSAAG